MAQKKVTPRSQAHARNDCAEDKVFLVVGVPRDSVLPVAIEVQEHGVEFRLRHFFDLSFHFKQGRRPRLGRHSDAGPRVRKPRVAVPLLEPGHEVHLAVKADRVLSPVHRAMKRSANAVRFR